MSKAFPKIDIDCAIEIPERTERDTSPATQEQIKTIEELLQDINRFVNGTLCLESNYLDEMGSAQANKLIRALSGQRERVLSTWRKSLKGRRETIKGKGFKIKVKVGSIDEEPTRKQIGYLKHLLEDAGVSDVPEYLFYALGKWDISNIISTIKGDESSEYGGDTDDTPSPSKSKKKQGQGCGCLIILILAGIIIYAIWKYTVAQ